MALTEASLDALLGKHIREICALGYAADSYNHCAHFVSHVLDFQPDHGKGTRNACLHSRPGCLPALRTSGCLG